MFLLWVLFSCVLCHIGNQIYIICNDKSRWKKPTSSHLFPMITDAPGRTPSPSHPGRAYAPATVTIPMWRKSIAVSAAAGTSVQCQRLPCMHHSPSLLSFAKSVVTLWVLGGVQTDIPVDNQCQRMLQTAKVVTALEDCHGAELTVRCWNDMSQLEVFILDSERSNI